MEKSHFQWTSFRGAGHLAIPLAISLLLPLVRALGPFCVLPHSIALDLSSFFNVLQEPFVRAIFLLSYCWSCIFVRFAATSVS